MGFRDAAAPARVVGALDQERHAGAFQKHGLGPKTLEGAPIVHVEEEVSAGAERAGGGTGGQGEFGPAGQVIQGVAVAQDEIDGAGQGEASHVGLVDGEGRAEAGAGGAGVGACQAAHGGRGVQGEGADAAGGKSEGRVAGAAGQVAGRLNCGEDVVKDAVAGGLEPLAMEGKEGVVVGGESAVGVSRGRGPWDGGLLARGYRGLWTVMTIGSLCVALERLRTWAT